MFGSLFSQSSLVGDDAEYSDKELSDSFDPFSDSDANEMGCSCEDCRDN